MVVGMCRNFSVIERECKCCGFFCRNYSLLLSTASPAKLLVLAVRSPCCIQSLHCGFQVAPLTDIKWTLLKVSIGRAQYGFQMAQSGFQNAPRRAQVDVQSIHFGFQVAPQTDIKWTLLKVSIGRAQPLPFWSDFKCFFYAFYVILVLLSGETRVFPKK